MNNLLPIYFENCKPTLPRIDQLYNVRKPVFHLPKIKHKFAEQLPDYQLVKLLNKNALTGLCKNYVTRITTIFVDVIIFNVTI